MGISAPPAGIAPKGKPMSGPRSHDFQVRRSSALPSQGRPTGIDSPTGAPQMGGDPQRLADGEEPDGDDHDVDAVGELQGAERQPLLAGHLVQADQADGEADQQRGEAADAGASRGRRSPR